MFENTLILVVAFVLGACDRKTSNAAPWPTPELVALMRSSQPTATGGATRARSAAAVVPQYVITGATPVDIWDATPPYDYQYDNSIVYTGRPDGLYYMWSCGTGDPNHGVPYDRIKLMKSNDGKVWTAPVVALEPSPRGLDWVAACNPTVFADASTGYWYMLYTAATHYLPSTGDDANAIFAARALDPNGPWEKWNGSGWGGNPMWVIPPDSNCDAPSNCYGTGEPSVVHTWGGVYVFWTQWNHAGSYEAVWVFHEGYDWPGQVAWGQLVGNKFLDSNGMHEGPWDVKLVVDNGLNKFMAIASVPYSDEPKVMILTTMAVTSTSTTPWSSRATSTNIQLVVRTRASSVGRVVSTATGIIRSSFAQRGRLPRIAPPAPVK
jgi:hypothetical protein